MIVHTVISVEDISAHRGVLTDWAKANGIDPNVIAEEPVSVEQDHDGTMLIRYREFQVNPAGRNQLDPRRPDRVWTIERTVPLRVSLAAVGYSRS